MSAVQFNLLPDVKLEYNRAQRQKRLVYGLSALACLIVLTIFAISFLSVDVLQKKLLSDANGQIVSYSNKIKSIPDIEKILTIQNQLSSLPNLHTAKRVSSRLFCYLPEITPAKINLGKLTMDTTANTMEFVGTADTVETVNKFVDTLKFTTYTAPQAGSIEANVSASSKAKNGCPATGNSRSQGQTPAFTNVILSQIDRNDKEATYTIDATFDPSLFNASKSIILNVPQETTTRSVLNTPASVNPIFNGDTGKKTNQQGGQ